MPANSPRPRTSPTTAERRDRVGEQLRAACRPPTADCARRARRRAAAAAPRARPRAPIGWCDQVKPCTNSPADLHGVVHRAARDREPERPRAARRALARDEDVGPHAPVVAREPRAGAAESGHHLVGDEQHTVRLADLGDGGPVVVGRHARAERRARDRLGHERGDALGADLVDRRVELRGELCAARRARGTGRPERRAPIGRATAGTARAAGRGPTRRARRGCCRGTSRGGRSRCDGRAGGGRGGTRGRACSAVSIASLPPLTG